MFGLYFSLNFVKGVLEKMALYQCFSHFVKAREMQKRGMAFKRSAVRSRLSPPKQYNPNLVPIGHGFGFIVFIEEVEDW